jgi:hypothetical protein
MCFIRYRGKSEKDFKLFPCDDIGCSVYYLKQFLMSKSASRRSKDEIDFIITDASTKEGLSLTIALSSHIHCSWLFRVPKR